MQYGFEMLIVNKQQKVVLFVLVLDIRLMTPCTCITGRYKHSYPYVALA